MVTVAQIARITAEQPRDAGEDQSNAWLLWTSVVEEAKRRGSPITEEGFYIYNGTLRDHVRRLWGTLSKDDREELEKRLYAFLNSSGITRCIRKKNPTVWHVAVTWKPDRTAVVRTFKMSHAERRVTKQEAGEHLPHGEVTTTTKETSPVGNATRDVAAPLRALQDKRREERDTRRDLTVELLSEYKQPLVTEEVAHAIGCNESTSREDLKYLVSKGLVFAREETKAERTLRYGAEAFAKNSTLYSVKNPVPKRTQRTAVDGYTAVRAVREPPQPAHVIDHCLAHRLAKMSERTEFDAISLAEQAGTQPEATRNRIRGWVEQKLVVKVTAGRGTRNKFRMKDKAALLKSLNYSNGNHEASKLEIRKPVVHLTPTNTPTPQPGFDLLARAGEILDENERLREQNARLQERVNELEGRARARAAQIESFEAEVAELKAQLEALNQPAVDEATVARLQGWSPQG